MSTIPSALTLLKEFHVGSFTRASSDLFDIFKLIEMLHRSMETELLVVHNVKEKILEKSRVYKVANLYLPNCHTVITGAYTAR